MTSTRYVRFEHPGGVSYGIRDGDYVHELDGDLFNGYGNVGLETRVNGEVRQSSSAGELVFSPDELLSYISRYGTLLPGKVILSGTPGQTRAAAKGDVIEVEIEDIGVLRNAVAA
jgi:2-keto-4-pentenoate hydratase/2-oxohepta-3-ene-1,7-dioic acid hydratase in catechol pathway